MVIINKNIQRGYKNFTGKAYNFIGGTNYNWFIKNDETHRYYGPASIIKNTLEINNRWYFNGKVKGTYKKSIVKYSQSIFLKDIGKQWLL